MTYDRLWQNARLLSAALRTAASTAMVNRMISALGRPIVVCFRQAAGR